MTKLEINEQYDAFRSLMEIFFGSDVDRLALVAPELNPVFYIEISGVIIRYGCFRELFRGGTFSPLALVDNAMHSIKYLIAHDELNPPQPRRDFKIYDANLSG